MNTYISLGAGVQSSALLLMSIHGVFPRATAAIFADTGCEPASVYEHLDWLEAHCRDAEFPLYRVSAGNLYNDFWEWQEEPLGLSIGQPPFFIQGERNTSSDSAQMFRKCTVEYKLMPIRRKIEELEHGRAKGTESWIGISLDEKGRAKPSQVKWITNRYPLLEVKLTRHDCLVWMQRQGFPLPGKSSCVICPFHTDAYWRNLQRSAPEDWAKAVAFDEHLRSRPIPGLREGTRAFIHRKCIPLSMVDPQDEHERSGQIALPLWGSAAGECEGACFI